MAAAASPDPVHDESSDEEPERVDLKKKGNYKKYFITLWRDLNMDTFGPRLTDACEWWAGQLERAPKTGRLHYHFVFNLKTATTIGKVRDFFGISEECDLWSQKLWKGGNSMRMIKYCMKEKTRVAGPWSGGDLPTEDRRAGDVILQLIKRNRPNSEIIEQFPTMGKNILMIREMLTQTRVISRRDAPPSVLFVHGEPGSGKSRYFHDMQEDGKECLFIEGPPETGTWFFNGYHGQHILVLDDCAPPTIKNVTHYLRLLDRYPMTVHTKGGHQEFNSPIIGITSNLTWDQWTANLNSFHKTALRRRITNIIEMNGVQESKES